MFSDEETQNQRKKKTHRTDYHRVIEYPQLEGTKNGN